MFQSIHKLI